MSGNLRGVVDREKIQIGVLITMQAPTADLRQEAASAGFYRLSLVDQAPPLTASDDFGPSGWEAG